MKELYFQIVYCHVNKTSQQYTALFTTYSHVLDGEIRAIAAYWCLIVRTWEDTPATLIVCPTPGRRHEHVAQCCRNIQPSFASVQVCKKFVWVLSSLIRNVDIKYFKKSKNSEKHKIMIWVIHYFITKIKTKIYVIPRSCFREIHGL